MKKFYCLKSIILVSIVLLVFADLAYSQAPVAIIQAGSPPTQNNDTIPLCAGSTINFTDVSTGTVSSRTWTFTNASVQTSTFPNVNNVRFSITGVQLVQLVVRNTSGTDTSRIYVDVSNAKPRVEFAASPTNICGNLPIQFTNNTQGAVSYTWIFSPGDTSTETNPLHALNIPGDGPKDVRVKLIASNSYGCIDSGFNTVRINQVPDARLTTKTQGVDSVNFNGVSTFRRCAPDPTYLFAFDNGSTTGTNAEYKIKWDEAGAEEVVTRFPVSHNYPIGNHELTLTVTNAAGCIGIRKYNVYLGTNPRGGIVDPGNTDLCVPSTLIIPISEYKENSPGTRYTFTFTDGSPTETYIQGKDVIPDPFPHRFIKTSCGTTSDGVPQTFKVNLEIANACRISESVVRRIYVSTKPEPRINFNPDSVVCVNTQVSLIDASLAGMHVSSASTTCNSNTKSAWKITPSIGWTPVNGVPGRLDLNDYNLWETGSPNLNVRFTVAGTYTVTLYKGNLRCGADSVTRTICVSDLPTASFTLPTHSNCGPITVTPSNESISRGCRVNTYKWSVIRRNLENCGGGGDGVTYINGTSETSLKPTWSFTLPGRYDIQLTAFAGATCINTYNDTIYIKDKPRVQINAVGTICAGDSIRPAVLNSASCYGNPITYAWDFTGSSSLLTSISPTPGFVTYNTTGNYSVKLIVANECGNSEASSPLQVVALPTANAGRDSTVCSDAPVTLGSAAITGYTYQWSPATGLSGTTTAQPVFRRINTTGNDITQQYILIVRIGSGCISRDTVNITVKSAPVITLSPSTGSVCTGDSLLVRASGAVTYTWTPVNGTNPGTGDSVWVKPVSNTTFQARGTDAYGCTATTSIAVTVRPLPNTDAGNPINPCLSNEEIPLTGSPAGGTWSGIAVTRTGSTYTFNPSVAGIGSHTLYYTVTLNGCSKMDSTIATVSGQQGISAGNDTTVCQNSSAIQLSGLPSGGTWTGSALVTAAGIFTPSQPGQFRLTYTTGTGSCRVSDEMIVNVLPGISNNTIRSNQDVCINAVPQLIEGTTPSGGGDNFSYQWQQSADNIAWSNLPNETAINYQPPATLRSIYYRRLVSTMMCSGPRQHTSNAVLITVHPDALAGFTATKNADCAVFELDPTVIKTDLRPDRNGTYLWFANGLPLNTQSSPAIPRFDITREEDTVVIRLLVQSQWGCRPSEFSDTFITIPGATAAFTKNVNSGCAPVKVKFTNTSSRINGVQHVWDFGNGERSTLAQPDTVTFNGSNFGNDTTYYITLSISNGCTISVFRDSVHVRPLPKASFGVPSTAICSSSPLEINNVSRGGPATYYWDYGNGDTSISTQTGKFNYTYYTGIADTFLLKMKMVNSCGIDSLSYFIVVSPNQIRPQVAVNGTQLIGCAEHRVDFINTTIGATRFIWDFNDRSSTIVTGTVPETVSHTFRDTGTYNVSVRMTNGCSDTVIYRQVIVLSGAKAGFTFPIKPYCERDSIRFVNNSVNAQSYLWLFGDGVTSSEASPTHAYISPGTYQVRLVAYRSTVYGTICPDTLTIPVTVVPRPLSTITIVGQQATNCVPFDLTVSASRAGALNANWYFDDPLDPAPVPGFIATHRYTKAGTYRVKLIVFNAAGCADSSFTFVNVRPSPVASFTQLSTITCSIDTTLNFRNTSTYEGTDATEFKWLVDGAAVGSSSNLNHRFRLPAGELLPKTFSVELVAASSFGCMDTALGSVRMNPTPIAGFSVLNGNDCAPHALRINNISQYADAFSWYRNDTLVSVERNPAGILVSRSNIPYVITLIATNVYGCSPDTARITVNTPPRPVAAFAIIGDPLSCTGILDVQLVNQSSGAVTYEWNFGDNSPRVFTRDARHLYPQPGEYTITLITGNNVCKDTTTKLVRVGVRPNAAFDVNSTEACSSLKASFKNLSTNASSYVWSFGDGSFSGQANPDHTYSFNNSPFTVRLIATGQYGCADTAIQLNYIRVLRPPVASFSVLPSPVIEIPEYTFNFLDRSSELRSPDYKWTFGDGGGSTLQSPSYTYKDTGSYSVSLIVVNKADGCADTATQQVRINGIPGWLQVPNAFQPGSGRSELNRFLPIGTGMKTYRLQIYNAWGELVFESTKLDDKGRPIEGWDGRYKRNPNQEDQHVQQDVFVWKIQATFLNGTEWKGMKYPHTGLKKTGTITVIK